MENEEFFGDIEVYRAAGELEAARLLEKDRLAKAKEQAADRMGGMVGLAMDALQMALVSDDEGVRLKAVGMVLDRLVPRVKATGGEAEEGAIDVPESRKNLLADVEQEIRKMGGGGSGSGSGAGGAI